MTGTIEYGLNMKKNGTPAFAGVTSVCKGTIFNQNRHARAGGHPISFFALAGFLTFLSACSLVQMPPVQLPPRDNIAPGETITVIGNQNVYGIAKQYNVSMRELIVLNNIHAPFTLRPGQKLTLPADHVASSDTFTPPGYAKSGGSSSYSSSSSSYGSSSGGPVAPPPVSASSGSVQSAELPPIEPAAVSSTPLPPPPTSPTPVTPHTLNSVTVPVTPAPTMPSAPPSAVNSLNAPTVAPKPVPTTMESGSSSSSESSTPSVSFAWPVQGPIVSGFGPKGQGLSNDGVNISAPKGSPVTAAGNGIVVYAGNEMKGFGNLVLIRHQGGWVTAYAHLDRTLVGKDAVVAKGDEIGTVGKTGNVSSPQLHFETRYNGKPVDPAGVIKGG